MHEIIESLKSVLDSWGELIETVLDGFSLLCIVLGAIFSLMSSYQYRRNSNSDHPLHNFFRATFGGWLIVALEFQLAADIAGTIISPTTAHLVELGAIAVIRTFLNYFLGRELTEEREALRSRNKTEKKEQANK